MSSRSTSKKKRNGKICSSLRAKRTLFVWISTNTSWVWYIFSQISVTREIILLSRFWGYITLLIYVWQSSRMTATSMISVTPSVPSRKISGSISLPTMKSITPPKSKFGMKLKTGFSFLSTSATSQDSTISRTSFPSTLTSTSQKISSKTRVRLCLWVLSSSSFCNSSCS